MDEHLLRFDSDKTYVFIDCETENLCLHEGHNLPWQIAMIKAKGGKKIDEKDYYVKWDRELSVSKEAARITRFNPVDHKKKALYYKDIFPTIEDWLHNCDYIVGHNILGFDIYLLKSYYESMGKPYGHLMDKIIDTFCIAKGIKLGVSYKPSENFLQYQYKVYHVRKKGLRNSLTALGKEFSIEHNYEMLHDAIVDLELNLKVWNQLKYQIEF
jgi:DNA polymerase III alpha subunit (gram-positive type)